MDSGQEQNYWPGFVDALSNVVLTLVFVLVIFVFALAMASNKVDQKMKEISDAAKNVKTETVSPPPQEDQTKKIQELTQQLQQAQIQLAALQAQLEKTVQQDQTLKQQLQKETSDIDKDKEIVVQKTETTSLPSQGTVQTKNDQKGLLTLVFPESTSDIDIKSQDQLSALAQSTHASDGKTKVIIKSVMGHESYSVAQRMAYYRVMNVRNFLMTKMGMNAASISSTIVVPDNQETGRVEILFQK